MILVELKEVLQLIDKQQKMYIDLCKKDKSKKKEVEAILTATTLLKMELQSIPKTTKDRLKK